ncbi:Leucine-rich repeat-containing protein 15 [Mizuhopecten yessoensis]|uniref:Leucine-rich repeat-containing protein 15 n=2 Tax=Mizuhopecten yessoensis TaxID=6573 RepID=A0A210QGE3_MIZYE|nr:Leucine-rich repeat-containing protein 15 [Mizuhopecten yessoensis]
MVCEAIPRRYGHKSDVPCIGYCSHVQWNMKRLRDNNSSVWGTLLIGWVLITSPCNACSPMCDCVGNYFAYCDRRELTSSHLIDLMPDLPVRISYIDFSHNVIRVLTNSMFYRHTALTTISLDHNVVSDVSGSTFRPLLRLRKLFLQHNQLPHLNDGIFFHLTQLRNLYLYSNRIRHLPDRGFAHLVNLRELHLNRNDLDNVTSEALVGLSRLQILNISDNNINIISDFSFASLTNLRKLFLENNKISVLTSKTFWNLTSLRELDLRNNCIVYIQAAHMDPFRQHIRVLRLSYNRLVSLRRNVFDDMGSLRVLDLNYNEIKTIEKGAFWYLDLNELHLKGNRLEAVGREMFLHTRLLRYVDLSHNDIHLISPGAWAGLGQSLHVLILTGNRLVDLSRTMVQGMSALRKLRLDSNQIVTIDPEFILQLPSLQTLDLRANNLRSLFAQEFTDLPAVPRLLLEQNPLRQFSGFRFVGDVHVSLNLTVTSKNNRTVNITWPYKGGNQIYWSVSVKNLNRTQSDNDITLYLQAYVTNTMIPGLSPLTHYLINVRPVFVDERVRVDQTGYVTTLGPDESSSPPTTLRGDEHASGSCRCRPLPWTALYCLACIIMLRYPSSFI